MITQRPAIVRQRARLGDPEIDTVHGRGKPGALTIVERKSGLVRIGKLARLGAQETLRRATTLAAIRNRTSGHAPSTSDNADIRSFRIYKQKCGQRLGTRISPSPPPITRGSC